VAYVFPSNHFHLFAGFPEANRAAFMRDFQGELSRRITDYRGCDGEVFPKRYDARAILDAETLLDKISYTVNNAVRHELVSHPQAWPGVGSFDKIRDDEPLVGRWLDCNKWHNLKRRQSPASRSEAMVEYTADLHVPTDIRGDSEAERRQTMLETIEEGRQEFCRQQTSLDRHRHPDDPDTYTRVDWRTQQTIDEEWCTIKKVCAGTEPGKVADYLERRRKVDKLYRHATEQWKKGEPATFPVGTYPPGQAQPVEQLAPRAPPN
ncbi:MAG: transposase, partial [Bradymonadaceae bacterium]